MLLDYAKSLIFIVISIIYFSVIGNAVCKKEDFFPKKIIIAYVIHSAIIGILGTVVQIVNIPWKFFMILQMLVICILFFWCIYILNKRDRLIKNKNHLIKIAVVHFSENWFIYIITFIMLGLSLANINLQLLNNHLDDGLYLLRIAQLPYVDNPYDMIFASGFEYSRFSSLSTFSYVFNVFDLEASVYNYLLGTNATIFARFALNWLNYYIFVQSFYWFICVITKDKTQIKRKYLQYFISPIVILCFYPEWLNHLFSVPDDWQISSAMWYGSSIVRCAGLFIMFIPLIENKINKKYFIYWILVSIALFTKSSIALPLIIFGLFLYLLFYFYSYKKKYVKFLIIAYILFMLVILYLVGIPSSDWSKYGEIIFTADGVRSISYHLLTLLYNNRTSILLYVALGAFIISFFKEKNKDMRKWNWIILICLSMIVIPIINYPFIVCSVYTHVARRMFTLLIYTLMLTGFTYLFTNVYILVKRNISKIILLSFAFLTIISFVGIRYYKMYGFRTSFNIIRENPYLMPQTTLDLSNELEEISKETNMELHVLAPDVVYLYGKRLHPLASVLRINALDTKIISAIPRFSAGNDMVYNSFDPNDQNKYRVYSLGTKAYDNKNENVEDAEIEEILEKHSTINCLVSTNKKIEVITEKRGFKKISQIEGNINYYIYVKFK